jgi:hypothetical protein
MICPLVFPNGSFQETFLIFCNCSIPCPCTFAQAPTHGDCEDVLAYHIKSGHYGETLLDGLNLLALSYFKGNIWAGGNTKANIASFVDERADQQQREALQMIFTGKAGGFMAQVSNLVEEDRGLYFAPIKLEVADDLSYWSAEIPGKIVAKAEALTGPMTPPGKRVQTLNPPGSEVGPSMVVTWGKAMTDEVNAPEIHFE